MKVPHSPVPIIIQKAFLAYYTVLHEHEAELGAAFPKGHIATQLALTQGRLEALQREWEADACELA